MSAFNSSSDVVRKQIDIAGKTLTVCGSLRDPYFANLEAHLTAADFLIPILAHHVLPKSVIVDVGANVGATTALIYSVVHQASVLCIEPSQVFNHLTETIRANQFPSCKSVAVAVGDHDGHVEFADAPDSSASHVARQGGARQVPMKRLDTIISEEKIERVDFVKIDVEGSETLVLDGMTAINSRFKPLIFMEFNSFTTAAYGELCPMAVLKRVRDEFTCFFGLRDRVLSRFQTDADLVGFLHQNMLQNGCVDDIVFTASDDRRAAFNL